jgi:hypothetical protein
MEREISKQCSRHPMTTDKHLEIKINLSTSTNGTSVGASVAASGNNDYVSWWDKSDGKDQSLIATQGSKLALQTFTVTPFITLD